MDLTGVVDAMQRLYAAVSAPAADGGAGSMELPELLELVEGMQQVQNVAAAVQSRTLAHVAAHDEEPDADAPQGWVWKRHPLGHVGEEAASLVADRLGVSVPVAARRVEDAVHQTSVTPRLLDVGGAGGLDAWRTRLVTAELRATEDDDAAREVVDRLAELFTTRGGWDETAGPLSARAGRLVRRLDPSVAAGDGERARQARCVNRRADGPAADQWFARLPVETSLPMWAVVDERAHQLQRADTALTLEQARADALAELVLQQSSVTVHLHATVPADTTRPLSGDVEVGADPTSHRRVVEVGGLGRPGTTTLDLARLPAHTQAVGSTALVCDPVTGGVVAGYVPKSLAPSRHRRPRASRSSTSPEGNEAQVVDGGTEPHEIGLEVEPGYRPTAALQRLVRTRDGTCRFPGCTVPARDCDLDHVRPWPDGPTSAANLAAVCRRHHRIKQLSGWGARLTPDGVMHWTDPTGRVMTTRPVDHLDWLTLPSRSDTSVQHPSGSVRRTRPADATTLAELTLERFLTLGLPRRQLDPDPPGRHDLQERPATRSLDAVHLDTARYREAQRALAATAAQAAWAHPPY